MAEKESSIINKERCVTCPYMPEPEEACDYCDNNRNAEMYHYPI